MVQKGKTTRWWQRNACVLRHVAKRPRGCHIGKERKVNPYWFRHDPKRERVRQHREYRHENRLRVRKGMEILAEPKTRGWL